MWYKTGNIRDKGSVHDVVPLKGKVVPRFGTHHRVGIVLDTTDGGVCPRDAVHGLGGCTQRHAPLRRRLAAHPSRLDGVVPSVGVGCARCQAEGVHGLRVALGEPWDHVRIRARHHVDAELLCVCVFFCFLECNCKKNLRWLGQVLAIPAPLPTPTYAGGIEETRPGCATGKHRINSGQTPRYVQATDSANLAGFNGAYAFTMDGGICYPQHGIGTRNRYRNARLTLI